MAFPGSGEEVRSLLAYAREHGVALIPYGGGTSVAGHINVVEDRPTLTVSLARMNRLLELDEASHLATFQAGVSGPLLESQLQDRGFTLGHYPQSFEYSTLGGWVATRSSGQFSLGYGRIEKLVAGLRVETPQGEMVLPAYPASAAGPDLKELFLGSEGRYGIITEVTVTGLPAAGTGVYRRLFLPRFSGRPGGRERTGAPPPAPDHAAAVHPRRNQPRSGRFRDNRAWCAGWSATCGCGGWRGKNVCLVYGAAGTKKDVAFARGEMHRVVRDHGGVNLGRAAGRQWYKNRFFMAYLRNSLWEAGYAVDTLETAVPWSKVGQLVDRLTDTLSRGDGRQVPLEARPRQRRVRTGQEKGSTSLPTFPTSTRTAAAST